MAKKQEPSQNLSLYPLTGVFDLRSRPSDVPPGGFRWRQNYSCSDVGKAGRSEGFSRLFPSLRVDDVYTNWDHSHQGATREAITFLFESSDNDGQRRLFDGTQSRISLLLEDVGLWPDIVTGKGASGTRWSAAELQDWILFTNNFDNVLSYQISTGAVADVFELFTPAVGTPPTGGVGVTKAAVIVEYNGSIFVMNVVQDGVRKSSQVRWSDLNKPLIWLGTAPSIAGFQDLDYGEDILAAKQMLGVLKIYTTRGIWNCTPSAAGATKAYSFQKIYSEPKNQSRCIAYPNTLVSTGIDHYYMDRTSICHFSPYLAEPEVIDWIHRADAAIFKYLPTKLDSAYCNSPIAEYHPLTKKIWFSWASAGNTILTGGNNWSLTLNIDQKFSSIEDKGFNAMVNYRPGLSSTETCNEAQLLIGASGTDWALKQLGDVFYREFVSNTAGVITNDTPLGAGIYVLTGYYSTLRGMIPLGLVDRDKIVKQVLIDDDVSQQDVPCVYRLRVGHSFKLVDPNDTDDRCTPLWVTFPDRPIACPDTLTVSQMQAQNLTPDSGTQWPIFERGRFLFFDLTIANADGSPAIGADVALQRIDFEVLVMPKP